MSTFNSTIRNQEFVNVNDDQGQIEASISDNSDSEINIEEGKKKNEFVIKDARTFSDFQKTGIVRFIQY